MVVVVQEDIWSMLRMSLVDAVAAAAASCINKRQTQSSRPAPAHMWQSMSRQKKW